MCKPKCCEAECRLEGAGLSCQPTSQDFCHGGWKKSHEDELFARRLMCRNDGSMCNRGRCQRQEKRRKCDPIAHRESAAYHPNGGRYQPGISNGLKTYIECNNEDALPRRRSGETPKKHVI